MSSIVENIARLRADFDSEIRSVQHLQELEQLRIKYLGRRGRVTELFKSLAAAPPAQKPVIGKALNEAKREIAAEIERLKSALQAEDTGDDFDVTLPGHQPFVGRLHPLMQVLDEIKYIFTGMGFAIETGPEVETDYYNFEALNIPADHPSRDMQDTLYLEGGLLLRTHTSPVQVRTMEKMRPPVRIIAPGRCFRRDTPDATHSPMFHQIEGLVVDEGVSMADLKGVLLAFMRKLIGPETQIRFRPSFFPFTEPSAEYDVSCPFCQTKGCSFCKESGWLEISGAGMVDPAVFGFVDYDPEKYTGYAFGMGAERIAMIKHQIGDIRLFYENDVRFLTQF